MTSVPDASASDEWYNWLLHLRQADDPQYGKYIRESIERYADHVLDGAKIVPGITLADIGTADGLVAFRAIERAGPTLRAILVDISAPLLRHAEACAKARGVEAQCSFIHTSADDLNPLLDQSVDVVTTRSVLAYVANKRAALKEFKRVLRPGGRISIAEPILRHEALATAAMRTAIEKAHENDDQLMQLLHRWKAAQYPDTAAKIADSPIVNYSEQDLLAFVRDAGFIDIHFELHIDAVPQHGASWEVFLGSSPHPLAPSTRTILAEQFTEEERQRFEQIARPIIEKRSATSTNTMVFIQARKP
jgi:ubiquinone/menaquinone biosynthesis C-methylase UbiE